MKMTSNEEIMKKLAVEKVNTGRCDELLGGNSALYLKLMKKFMDDPDFENLGKAIDSGDLKGQEDSAHSLKGVSGNIGIDLMYRNFSEIVAVRRNQAQADVKADYDEAMESRRKIIKILEDFNG